MTKWIAVLLTALMMAGCGGGDEDAEAAVKFADRMRAAGVANASQTAVTSATAEMTLDWIEYKFPDLFPKAIGAHFPNVDYLGVTYNARAYAGAWGTRYVAITPDGRIFGLGDFTGEALQQFDDINHWSSQVLADKCNVHPGSCGNVPPVANAGPPQNVITGTLVTLDGTASSDANGDQLTYSWRLTSKPVGSVAGLVSATSARPTFTADLAGSYEFTLIVTDGKSFTSEPATTTVTAGPRVVGALGLSLENSYSFCGINGTFNVFSSAGTGTWTFANCGVYGTAGSVLWARIRNNGSTSLQLTRIHVLAGPFGKAWTVDPSSQTISPGATLDFGLPLWLGLEVTNAVATFSIAGEQDLVVTLTENMRLP